MNENFIGKWKKQRAKGIIKFDLIHGVAVWGVTTAILFSLVMPLIEKQELSYFASFIEQLKTAIIVFPLGGIVFGLWTWVWNEKIYQKQIEKNGKIDE